MDLPVIFETAAGRLRLRAGQPDDDVFLRRLFDASRPLAAQLAHLPADLRETVLHGQYQAQRQGHAAQFPHARALIILLSENPAGRLLYDDTGPAVHIADIALLPRWQGQGIGTSLLLALADAAAPRGLSLAVAADNAAAQRLYARLGFVLTGQTPAHLQLTRRPSR